MLMARTVYVLLFVVFGVWTNVTEGIVVTKFDLVVVT